MRPAEQIRTELEELSARRADAWQRLSQGEADARKEIAFLTRRVDELWRELREATLARRYGPRERIIARARASERFERELRRRNPAAPEPTASAR